MHTESIPGKTEAWDLPTHIIYAFPGSSRNDSRLLQPLKGSCFVGVPVGLQFGQIFRAFCWRGPYASCAYLQVTENEWAYGKLVDEEFVAS